MNLTKIANQAAAAASQTLGTKPSATQLEKITVIIAEAMKSAVLEASNQHTTACCNLQHDQDMAHKIRQEIERKKIGLIANLSSLR